MGTFSTKELTSLLGLDELNAPRSDPSELSSGEWLKAINRITERVILTRLQDNIFQSNPFFYWMMNERIRLS